MNGLETIFLNLVIVILSDVKYNGEFNDVFLNHERVHLWHKAMTALPQPILSLLQFRAK